eukprot:CAMPEP_0196813580 /NCGR_PEP_ID=MMETSP1362-20130617/37731_1 /TAXON_ID=163516 /ORGANISM="Leptocylindrus danicus, Strain CCMP1856" /LENGTH=691 /DNA_ID=CAMNT_0042189883 /DNA_START=1289 /DNA_END=3364 /DNA_ORIENTATION=+
MSSHDSIQSSNKEAEAEAREDQDVASLITIPITTSTTTTTETGTKFIKCQITRLPQHGTLYDLTAPTTPLRSNDLLSKLVEINLANEGCSVLYKAEAGWFSIPDTMSNGTAIHHPTKIIQDWLEYRTVEIDPMWSLTEGVPNASNSNSPQRVIVKVQNSNDAPVLKIGNDEDGNSNSNSNNNKKNENHFNNDNIPELLNVWTFSTLVGEDDSCWGDNAANDPNELSSCKTRARLGNITLIDADRDVDRVRVDVRTGNGMLTIHPLDLSLVDFNTCSNRTRYYDGEEEESSTTATATATAASSSLEWNCVGDGANDSWMSFLAQPSDVGPILSRTTYQSLISGHDTINITVYDGAGGPCPNDEERRVPMDENGHSYTSHHSTCFVVSGTIPVMVRHPRNIARGRNIIRDVPIQAWAGMSGVLLCIIFVIVTAVQKRGGWKGGGDCKKCYDYLSTMRSLLRQRGASRNESSLSSSSSSSSSDPNEQAGIEISAALPDDDLTKSQSKSPDTIPIRRRSSKLKMLQRRLSVQWYAFRDQVSGDTYYQNRLTRRVTWTKPREDEKVQLISNEKTSSSSKLKSDSTNNHLDPQERFLEYEEEREYECEESSSSMDDEGNRQEASFDGCTIEDLKLSTTQSQKPSSENGNGADRKHSPRWKSYKDEATGDSYFMNKYTRRVTWSEPNEEYDPVDGYLA